ncbi:hypothetical protein M885DRAFT_625759 [Pelagophyceae sp. CCMP2097]|nr:hypothetical protein M885DRAFT_625759 [Pelagophyceae sp. CCMP2097]
MGAWLGRGMREEKEEAGDKVDVEIVKCQNEISVAQKEAKLRALQQHLMEIRASKIAYDAGAERPLVGAWGVSGAHYGAAHRSGDAHRPPPLFAQPSSPDGWSSFAGYQPPPSEAPPMEGFAAVGLFDEFMSMEDFEAQVLLGAPDKRKRDSTYSDIASLLDGASTAQPKRTVSAPLGRISPDMTKIRVSAAAAP